MTRAERMAERKRNDKPRECCERAMQGHPPCPPCQSLLGSDLFNDARHELMAQREEDAAVLRDDAAVERVGKTRWQGGH